LSDAADTEAPAPTRNPRLHALDGLRGVAAVVVVAFHVFLYAELSETASTVLLASPLGLIVNGPGAVHIFFVLSGYVLALSLSRDTGSGRLARFYVRQLFRIQPPYMAAVLFAWAASSAYPRLGTPGAQCFQIPAQQLPRALAFPSMAFGQLPVGWSLFVELALSVVFPLLLLLARRLHPLVPVLLGLPLLFEIDPRLRFLRFTIDFALGALLFLERDRVAVLAARLPRALQAAWVVAAIASLQAPYALAVYQTGRC
jgi:peptidoglycan/LPS O-acetylase OafA/YrhL